MNTNKLALLNKLKILYEQGENIIQCLQNYVKNGGGVNTPEDILISYDLQAGSYIKGFSKNSAFYQKYCKYLAEIIDNTGECNSIIEIGVGEATTLNMVISNMRKKPSDILGFDLSWSRLKFAKEFLNDFNQTGIKLFTANLFEIPLLDNSVDIVYTSHSIEPNGGKEEEAIRELYRIARKYLILLEPSYEFATPEAKKRMQKHGYIKNLSHAAKKLEYKIIEHRLFDYSMNPLNPTGLLVIEKKASAANDVSLVCPVTGSKLEKYGDTFLRTQNGFITYPVIDNIPCLLKENAILTTQLLTDYNQYKIEHEINFSK
jgi:ubiquinone/menaquinone biosynthesis C-methylase UbiE